MDVTVHLRSRANIESYRSIELVQQRTHCFREKSLKSIVNSSALWHLNSRYLPCDTLTCIQDLRLPHFAASFLQKLDFVRQN